MNLLVHHVQFCLGDRDITGEVYAEDDATEMRAWTEDGILLCALGMNSRDEWYVCASDVYSSGAVVGSREDALRCVRRGDPC